MTPLRELKYAICKDDYKSISRILNGSLAEPDVECLGLAIFNRNIKLTAAFIGFPYFIKPNEDCLVYAIQNSYTGLIDMILGKEYEIIPTKKSLVVAIQQCNLPLVQRILSINPSIQITEEVVYHISNIFDDEDTVELRRLIQSVSESQKIKPLPYDFLTSDCE